MREPAERTRPNRLGHRNQALVAAAAAGALGQKLGPSEAAKVIGLLRSADPQIREDAMCTLARYGGRQYVGYITKCLNDSDIRVRVEACRTLGEMRAHVAKGDLYDALQDNNAYVRCAAAEALARMGDKSGTLVVARLICITGPHQIEAVRTYNLITGRRFNPTDRGVKEAADWIRTYQAQALG